MFLALLQVIEPVDDAEAPSDKKMVTVILVGGAEGLYPKVADDGDRCKVISAFFWNPRPSGVDLIA